METAAAAAATKAIILIFFIITTQVEVIAAHPHDSHHLRAAVIKSAEAQTSHLQKLKSSLPSDNHLEQRFTSDNSTVSSSNTTTPTVYHLTSYGADPTGKTDSTDSIVKALSHALNGPPSGFLINGILNLGGARIDLDGGTYLVSRPIQFPVAGRGNLLIHGGSFKASDNFPNDGYLIDMSGNGSSSSGYIFEFITFRDLLLDSNFRGGGIKVVNSLRINIDNCYVTHFNTTGILAQSGHETSIRHTYVGQHITPGGDPDEKNFSGIGIELAGNDNIVTDVVVFSGDIGILITGQANMLTGVHCYNKATGLGGIGIYVKVPELTQTRIDNSYMDFTGIVAEDPVQLTISNTFFLGDANIVLKSVQGVVYGVNIVDNMFTGNNNSVDMVRLDGAFNQIDEVVIDRNSVKAMNVKATVGRASVEGRGRQWTADFSSLLLFPNLITQVHYSLVNTEAAGGNGSKSSFPNHALTNVFGNKVVIQSRATVKARVYVTVDQGRGTI